jgi:hypothetical protein
MDKKGKKIEENIKKEKEFLPFFCFNKIGYIQRQQQTKSKNLSSPEPRSVEEIHQKNSKKPSLPGITMCYKIPNKRIDESSFTGTSKC